MRYKDICQWIKQEAKKIPDEGYPAREYYFDKKSVPEDSEEPHFMSENMRIFKIGEYKANHARRLKRIWKKTKSFEALNEYFLKFDLQLNYSS